MQYTLILAMCQIVACAQCWPEDTAFGKIAGKVFGNCHAMTT
jgi:hypothetical protein